ncbi:head-tail connector protein [Actinophytocola sp. NPDC049390]|uniref:head-tail connector protein n=1 Tax=Actinophytocola sp. NPDC049390 TaxID=3363894 RepID=UPI0037AD52EB
MAWAPDYCASADLKAYLRVGDTIDDAQIALAISAASRSVDRYANRQFGLVAAPEARTYTAYWDRNVCKWAVQIDDLMTETGLVVETTYTMHPRNAAQKGRPWTRLYLDSAPADTDAVEVSGRWGWTTVPDPVKQATLLQANRILERRDAPFGIAGSPDQGSEMRILAKVDPDAAVVLGPYVRQWGAV